MKSLLEQLCAEGLVDEAFVKQPGKKGPPEKVDLDLPQTPNVTKADITDIEKTGSPRGEGDDQQSPEGETGQVSANGQAQDKNLLLAAHTIQAAATALESVCEKTQEYNEEARSSLESMKNECANMKAKIYEMARL